MRERVHIRGCAEYCPTSGATTTSRYLRRDNGGISEQCRILWYRTHNYQSVVFAQIRHLSRLCRRSSPSLPYGCVPSVLSRYGMGARPGARKSRHTWIPLWLVRTWDTGTRHTLLHYTAYMLRDSYRIVKVYNEKRRSFERLFVIRAGFKPATPTSVVWYSIQLS